MTGNPLKKNKIHLTDYPFQKDIKFRLLMAELSVLDVDVITEILHSSLTISISSLAQNLEVDKQDLIPTLTKLENTQLYRIENEIVFVDKEMRKYYEFQIQKFDDDFRGDMEFLRGLLNKVPIHVLPLWYSLPRTSDDIFHSIVEKFLLTPKIYMRYLNELSFEDPIINQIMDDVFSAPDYKIRSKTLLEKYSLTREQFEEYMLLLEFNLVCCLSYRQNEDRWEEVITPFYEWRYFLRAMQKAAPHPIKTIADIHRTNPNDFGFVQDMTKVLSEALKNPISLSSVDGSCAFTENDAGKILSHPEAQEYTKDLIDKLEQLQLAEIKDNTLLPGKIAATWLGKPLQEQALSIYGYSGTQSKSAHGGHVDRDLRATEKCLKKISNKGWIYFDDFVKSCTSPVGDNQPVSLQRKGKRWKYQLPEYSSEDHSTLKRYVFKNLFQAGIVATGVHDGKPCFCVTSFGQTTLV